MTARNEWTASPSGWACFAGRPLFTLKRGGLTPAECARMLARIVDALNFAGPPCAHCNQSADSNAHNTTLAECETAMAKAGRGPCAYPTEHHAFELAL